MARQPNTVQKTVQGCPCLPCYLLDLWWLGEPQAKKDSYQDQEIGSVKKIPNFMAGALDTYPRRDLAEYFLKYSYILPAISEKIFCELTS